MTRSRETDDSPRWKDGGIEEHQERHRDDFCRTHNVWYAIKDGCSACLREQVAPGTGRTDHPE